MGKTRCHRQLGGDLAGNPPSAWGWGLGTFGNGWTQFTNSLMLQPGQNSTTNQSNNIVPIKGGKRRRKSVKHGGNVLAQAIVPFSLLAMNNALGSRKRRKRH
jgi:hypothetical protein